MRLPFVIAAYMAGVLLATPGSAEINITEMVKIIKAIPGDTEKLKTFCELLEAVDEADKNKSNKAEADQKIRGYLSSLGSAIATAWTVGYDIDAASPEGKAFDAAVDEVEDKCPN